MCSEAVVLVSECFDRCRCDEADLFGGDNRLMEGIEEAGSGNEQD